MNNKRIPRRRTRWTTADAKAALAEWESSGLSLAAYGRQQGIDPLRLSRWRRQLSAEEGPALVPVTSSGLGTIRLAARGLVVETARLRIEVHDYDPAAADWIGRLVRATETPA